MARHCSCTFAGSATGSTAALRSSRKSETHYESPQHRQHSQGRTANVRPRNVGLERNGRQLQGQLKPVRCEMRRAEVTRMRPTIHGFKK